MTVYIHVDTALKQMKQFDLCFNQFKSNQSNVIFLPKQIESFGLHIQMKVID